MNGIKYVNIENWELLTIEQLQDFYKNEIAGQDDYQAFDDYLSACLTRNNGSLEEVTKITETFYRTKSGNCYSINEQMVCNNINSELSDLYFDHEKELDEIALNLNPHTFEELIDNYYLRLDNYNHDEIQKQLCIIYETDNVMQELENLVKLMIDSTFFE